MRIKTLKKSWLIVLIALGLFIGFTACTGDDDDDDDSAPSDPKALAIAGWHAFEALDWDEAIQYFEAAISAGASSTDAFVGAGWTYYFMADGAETMTKARDSWNSGLGKSGSENDIYVGLGLLEYDLNNIDAAISNIRPIATSVSNYKFTHMPSIDINDLYLTLAKCYYLNGVYEADGDDNDALDFISYLNEHFSPERDNNGDLTDVGIDEIAQEIERLGEFVR